MKASEFQTDLKIFLDDYSYQSQLTKRLDHLENRSFTQELVNEIVLWKLNRYVSLDEAVLRDLEKLRGLKAGDHQQGESVLRSLVGTHGVDLPMASTILRFRNARTFQIIDRHAFRGVYDKNYPLYPSSSTQQKIKVYFGYLDQLVDLCKKRGLTFETIDRLLYVFDKRENGKLSKEKDSQQR